MRKKNILGTMMQSFALMALITVLWALCRLQPCFAPGISFIGGLDYVFLRNVGAAPNADYAATIPQQTFMIFQLMFAIITPALIAGAFAERMKFSAMVVFTAFWFVLVYAPMAHMVWGQGGLLNASLGGRSRRWILPAARWCTSLRESPRWSARSIWASASDIRAAHAAA